MEGLTEPELPPILLPQHVIDHLKAQGWEAEGVEAIPEQHRPNRAARRAAKRLRDSKMINKHSGAF